MPLVDIEQLKRSLKEAKVQRPSIPVASRLLGPLGRRHGVNFCRLLQATGRL